MKEGNEMTAQTHLTQRLMDNLTHLVNDAANRGLQSENISVALAVTIGRVIGLTSDNPDDAESSVTLVRDIILETAKHTEWPERKDNEMQI